MGLRNRKNKTANDDEVTKVIQEAMETTPDSDQEMEEMLDELLDKEDVPTPVEPQNSDEEMEEELEELLKKDEEALQRLKRMKTKGKKRSKQTGKLIDKKQSKLLIAKVLSFYNNNNLDDLGITLYDLSNYNLKVDDLLQLKSLWHSDNEEVDSEFSNFLLEYPDIGLMSIHKLLEEEAGIDEKKTDRDYVVLEKLLWTVVEFAEEYEDLWEICVDILVKHMRKSTFSSHDVCFSVLKYLHGIEDQKPYIYSDEIIPPIISPSNSVVDAVRQAYEHKQIHPQESGGFIDFLEECIIPPDPSDKMVQSLEANTWEGQYDDVPENDRDIFGLKDSKETPLIRKKLHEQRLAGLKDHYKFLMRKKRATTIGKTINKALIAFVLFFILMALHSYQQIMYSEGENKQA